MRSMGEALMREGSSMAPVQSITEGMARALTAGVGGYYARQAEEQQKAKDDAESDEITKIFMGAQASPEVNTPSPMAGGDFGIGGGDPGAAGEYIPAKPGGYEGMIAAAQGATTPGGRQLMQQALMGQMQAKQQAAAREAEIQAAKDMYLFEQQNKAPVPKSPKTVKTAEGVFILNGDGTLGDRLGGAKPETEINIGGELSKDYRPIKDDAGNTIGAEPIPGGKEDPNRPGALTPGEEAVDRAFAKTYSEEFASGGIADAEKNLAQLEAVTAELTAIAKGESNENLTGPLLGRSPDFLKSITNQKSLDVRDRVEEVVQRNLRVILGAQFTEEEGKRLIARAYNPNLDEAANAERLKNLTTAMKAALNAKKEAAKYWEENGTLSGYKGSAIMSLSDIEGAIENPPTDLKSKYGLE